MIRIKRKPLLLYFLVGVVLLSSLQRGKDSMAQSYVLYIEKPREYDESYQRDHADYSQRIKQIQHILSVRADKEMKALLLSTPVFIINRGRAEAFARGKVIYFDIALLDLLAHFSDELSLAEVKSDLYHQLVFNLAYAAALNGEKKLPLLDPYNTVNYTEEQKAYLWQEKLRSEKVIFENILGFIVAHEFSHLKLDHENVINRGFPDEQARHTGNTKWTRQRREMELAADETAARLCLNSLIQPAQLIPWLDLNEIRRRYYGKASEYPTTAQRIAVIQKAYVDIVGVDAMDVDLRDFNPLPPHRDVAQTDYNLFLEEFEKIRDFRQSLLIEIDRIMAAFIKEQFSVDEIAAAFYIFVERQKDLLKGAEHDDVLEQLIQLVSAIKDQTRIDVPSARSLVKKAGIGEYATAMIYEQLEQNPVDWIKIGEYLDILKKASPQFYDGITYSYLLANTFLRWHPQLFAAIQEILPEEELSAKRLKPFRLDQPLRAPLPTYEQQLQILRSWDGKYPDLSS